MFFSELTKEVNRKHINEGGLANDLAHEGAFITTEDGDTTSFSDGVVRLETIIFFVNQRLNNIKNPKSEDKRFPHLLIGELLPANQVRNGAFFFLEPLLPDQPPPAVTAAAASPPPPSPPGVPPPAAVPASKSPPSDAVITNVPSADNQAADEDETPAAGRVGHHAGHAARRWSERAQAQTAAVPRIAEDGTKVATADSAPSPQPAESPPVPSNSAVQRYGNLPQTTGSAVLYHPELKVFKRPESYPIRGVDLSWWNGAIPFEKLAGKHEIQFAYLKATEGADKKDPAFDDLLKGARGTGILTGAYHFFNFCDSPQSQFENISKTATGEMDLPFAIAVEWRDGPPDPKQHDCARDAEAVKSNLRQLLEDVTARYKKVPIIYAPPSAVGTLIDASFSSYPIWLADYHKVLGVRKPTMRGRNPWTIWQFTDHATLPGLDKPVELSVFFGNEEQFSSFVKGEGNIGLSAAEKLQ